MNAAWCASINKVKKKDHASWSQIRNKKKCSEAEICLLIEACGC